MKSRSVFLLVLAVIASMPICISFAFSGLAGKAHAYALNQPALYQYPFQNPELPVEQRIDNLISLMSLDEKVICLGTNPSVPRLGIKASGHVEGIHGLTLGGPGKWGRNNPVTTTTFPQGIGLGETWDPEIVRQAASVEGYEARYIFQNPKYNRGGIVIRSPNADLGRDPRWGRTEECYGEDAFFNGTMVQAFVHGLQGDNPKYWQSASLLKHFLANSNENGRESSSSNFDERLFREYYSAPFRDGIVKAGARAFMASYNRVNAIPMAVNPILENITRREWGEDGIICTDGGAMRLLVTGHKYFPDFEHAAAACVKAGINQFLDNYREAINSALKDNLVTEADIDKVLRGVFRVMIHLGLLDPPDRVPYSAIGTGMETEPWDSEKHKSLARRVTQESIVLLKNQGNLLPLDKQKLRSFAVIGPRANEVFLDWYSGTPPYAVSPLDGIKAKAGPNATVEFSSGDNIDEAARVARSADVAIVCVGNHPTGGPTSHWAQVSVPSEGREAVDRQSITLEQEDLIKRIYQANPRTIVVLISSFPYAINWTQENIPAIVHMAHNSQEEGNALADVLFGDYNPAGRLVQTWPRSIDQLPPMMDYDIRHGRTYMYFKGEPLYPFGYGMSYTSFEYSNLRLSAGSLQANGLVTATIDLRNTGRRSGEEVVQLYVRHLNSLVERPSKELKGFARVALEPGQSRTASITLNAADLCYWNEAQHKFVLEKGKVELLIGASSSDIKLRKGLTVM